MSYEIIVNPPAQYTIEYSNQRGPQGPAGPAGTGLSAIASGTILGNGLGDTALPQALNAVGIRTILDLATFDSPIFAGLTLSGLQQFTGTSTVGLRLKSLTTAEYNALTAANGDLFRDSTADRIDARLARGTVELIDSAGGQTINGALTLTGDITTAQRIRCSAAQLQTTNAAGSGFIPINTLSVIIGAGGPQLDSSSGTIRARNAAGSADAPVSCSNLTASGTGSFRGSENVYSFSSTHPNSAAPSTSWRFGNGWAGNYDTQFIFAYGDNAAKVLIDSTGAITAFGGYYVNVPPSSGTSIRPLQHGNSFVRFSAPASGIPGNNIAVEGWDSVLINASTGVIRNRIGGSDRLVLSNTDLTLTGNFTASGNITYSSIAFPELVTNGGFDTDTAWSKGTGWTISGGVAVATSVVSFADIQQNLSAVNNGMTYVIVFTVVATSGTVAVFLGTSGNTFARVGNFSVSGTYSFLLHKNSSDPFKTIIFRAESAFTGTVDNVSVKRAF
jgi:hypothetical protein